MLCKDSRRQIESMFRLEEASAGLRQHLLECDGCRKLFEERRLLQGAIIRLRSELSDIGPSRHVEEYILAELNGRGWWSDTASNTWRWLAAGALTSIAVFVSAFVMTAHRNAAVLPAQAADEQFTAMPYVIPPAPYERTSVVRTEVPLQILLSAGFQVQGEDPVQAHSQMFSMVRMVVFSPFDWPLNPATLLPEGWTDMRLLFHATLAVITSPLLAQVSLTSVGVQEPAWVGSPDWSATTVHVNTPAGQAGPILHKPFSATELRHSQQVLSDGAHVDHSDTSQFYRDGQGRMRVEGSRVVVLFDPTINATYTLHLKEKIYDQYSAGSGKYSTTIAAYGNSNHIDTPGVTGPVQTVKWGEIPYGSEPVTHVDTEQLGMQTINGLTCRGTRVTMTIPAHAVGNDRDIHVINERWYSDELAVLVKSTNDDPRFGTSSYELTDVSRNAPDPSLFKLPEGFTKSSRR